MTPFIMAMGITILGKTILSITTLSITILSITTLETFSCYFYYCFAPKNNWFSQGMITEGEGLVQLISSLR
jgi:hypothetical protein